MDLTTAIRSRTTTNGPLDPRPVTSSDHPNYVAVAAEIASLPLAFDARRTAVLASIANAAVLTRRIRVENSALRPVPTHDR
jgi:methyltransferase